MPLRMCSDMRGEPGVDGVAVGVNMKLISETLGHARRRQRDLSCGPAQPARSTRRVIKDETAGIRIVR
ncbi:hypothetical protein ACFFWA_06950 [Actinomadura verrucosospora]|uniref:hypothetical protein n=1 Tax=Actinomadura verrucosospora TaxID=46165 RepID=UPI0031E7F4D7